MKNNCSIKKKIYEVRRAKGVSQEEMANRMGIALNSYRKLERGKTSLVNSKLWDIANALGVSVRELVLEEDQSTGISLAEAERNEFKREIEKLKEENALLKQHIVLLNEKTETYTKNKGTIYP
ncbi:MAG: helix-turn-helix domain-containing protein [Bacteroidales bacterium]|nr:helix-turn-helix domain-containing protein [Bacteroidales bacterium]MBR4088146.1 helix-turn-helix domain-containing protein [Bacteroidales bacterium]